MAAGFLDFHMVNLTEAEIFLKIMPGFLVDDGMQTLIIRLSVTAWKEMKPGCEFHNISPRHVMLVKFTERKHVLFTNCGPDFNVQVLQADNTLIAKIISFASGQN